MKGRGVSMKALLLLGIVPVCIWGWGRDIIASSGDASGSVNEYGYGVAHCTKHAGKKKLSKRTPKNGFGWSFPWCTRHPMGFTCKETHSKWGIMSWYSGKGIFCDVFKCKMPVISIATDTGDAINSKEEYIDAKIKVINTNGYFELIDQNIEIRLRGTSSLYADKKSYKMKFPEKLNLLNIGEAEGKPWCLISNCFDGSLLRNLTVFRFADLLDGMAYSPNCCSVELFINNEYQGVYLLCEDKNVNKNRIAIEEEPDEVEQNGYMIEMSRYDEKNSFDVDKQSYAIQSDLSTNDSVMKLQLDYISNYLGMCINSLKSGDKTEAATYIDLGSLVDIYIGNEIAKNVDVGWSSFIMYKDAGGKLCFGPMWDFDLAMGNANCVKGFDSWAGINPYHVLNLNANSNPWFCYALGNEWFRNMVQERWKVLQVAINTLPYTVIAEAESHYKSYCRNYKKWENVLGKQVYIEPKQISALKTFKEHYLYLSDWLDNRTKWLTKYYMADKFINGIFVDENGDELNAHTNIIAISSILALANAPEVQMTYEILPNEGMVVSIQDGGTENWHMQIGATGFMLDEGTEYELSFDYKCSAEHTFSLNVQQNHGEYISYFDDNLTITPDLQHYSASFVAPKDDSNCALAFSFGGDAFNGTVVTIDKMNLVVKTTSSN